MHDLIVSINKNQLKLSVTLQDSFQTKQIALDSGIIGDSKVEDPNLLHAKFYEQLGQFENISIKKLGLIFLVDPSEVNLSFVTVEKSETDIDEAIISKFKEKYPNVSLEERFFGYQKIAPFVYQFISIEKTLLERYLDISNTLGMPLEGLVPWSLMLPKFMNTNDSCIFVVNNSEHKMIALAELNGIYFQQQYDESKDPKEILNLIQDLSVYKRSKPIHDVYVIGDMLNFGDDFDVKLLLESIGDQMSVDGFEHHLISDYVLSSNADYLDTQVNLLTLLPVPQVSNTKSKVPTAVGVSVGALLLVAGLVYYGMGAASNSDNLAMDSSETPVVLSESTPNITPTPTPTPDVEENLADLDRSELKIRVENGAGIAGIAGDTQEFLENEGFTVVEIDNADELGREDTLLRFKKDALKYLDLVDEVMSKEYSVVLDDENLDDSLEYDLLIIVGSN